MQVHKPLILFDGTCNFCSASVRFIINRDRREVFEFASKQSAVGAKLLAARGVPDDLQSIVILDRHHLYQRSDAVIFICSQLGGIYSVPAFFGRLIPRNMRDGIYNFMARRRHKIMGKKEDACPVMPAQFRRRFID